MGSDVWSGAVTDWRSKSSVPWSEWCALGRQVGRPRDGSRPGYQSAATRSPGRARAGPDNGGRVAISNVANRAPSAGSMEPLCLSTHCPSWNWKRLATPTRRAPFRPRVERDKQILLSDMHEGDYLFNNTRAVNQFFDFELCDFQSLVFSLLFQGLPHCVEHHLFWLVQSSGVKDLLCMFHRTDFQILQLKAKDELVRK